MAHDWEARVSGLRDQWAAMNVTVRLFKVGWQGQELSRDAVVSVLQQMLEPIGEVQGNMAVYSEMFDNRGVQANEDEEVLGFGGGMYVPIVMRHLGLDCSQERKAQWLKQWDGQNLRCQRSWGQAMELISVTAQQATSLLECLCCWQTGGRQCTVCVYR